MVVVAVGVQAEPWMQMAPVGFRVVDGARFDYVLFDLGGVLVRLGGVGKLRELSGIATDDEVWRRWLSCPWVRTFERGHCTAEDFAAGVVAEWSLEVEPVAFLEQFRGWPEGLFDGAAELVAAVRRTTPAGCLSNTNTLHSADASLGLDSMFDVTFLSHELGLVKPDPEVFVHVVDALDVPPERVVFLDDNQLNVDAARAARFAAVRVQGPREAERALQELGVLRADTHDSAI